jgi:hypothetical protein
MGIVCILLFVDIEIFKDADVKTKVRSFSASIMQFYPSLPTVAITLVLLKSFRDMREIKLENESGFADEALLIVEKMISVAASIDVSEETLLEWSDMCKQSFDERNAAYVNLTGEGNGEFMVPYSTSNKQM